MDEPIKAGILDQAIKVDSLDEAEELLAQGTTVILNNLIFEEEEREDGRIFMRGRWANEVVERWGEWFEVFPVETVN